MKLKFNFISTRHQALIASGLLAALGGLSACRDTSALPPPGLDGGDAQRIVSLIDYVGADYGLAVRNGAVVSEFEYEEQRRFLADATRLLRDLLAATPQESDDEVRAALAEIAQRVEHREEAEIVGDAGRRARELVVARFALSLAPRRRPDALQAVALYAEQCARCHGGQGAADTETARTLDPPPASFREAQKLAGLSPYRVYNALTFGVPGTGMASFAEALSPDERWSLAFHVFRLGHAGRAARGPVRLTLGELATRSDEQLLHTLRASGHAAPEQALSYARMQAAFAEPPTGVGLERTRELVVAALTLARSGRWDDADRVLLDAYLDGFEPLEARLAARDPEGTRRVEEEFQSLRSAIAAARLGDTEQAHARLDALLLGLAGQKPGVTPALAAFLIFFREGIEAALLVAALLAAVRRLGRPEAARSVHAGWMLAVPAGLATWWLMDRVVSLAAHHRELLEAGVALLAAAVLFSVSFWLISKAESRHWMAYLKANVERGLRGGRLASLVGVSFLAVYREAAETVLFTQALLLEAEGNADQVWLGALAGVAAVVLIAAALGHAAKRLPIGPFFAVSGGLLLLLAVSFAGSGIYTLVAAGYITPRPVPFPALPWIGVHADLAPLLVQLAIVCGVASAALSTLRRDPDQP